jgi:molybdopterin synthase catalytic subunit
MDSSPLSSPSDSVLIELTESPLALERAMEFVQDIQAGGIDIFLGTTRADIHPEHGRLEALDYAAYPEMALKQLRELVTKARAQWPICKVAVMHRTGRVPVGQPSVIIAVSSPHRSQAFSACRYLIDELKKSVPIWKKDIYSHGQQWQGEDDHTPPESERGESTS